MVVKLAGETRGVDGISRLFVAVVAATGALFSREVDRATSGDGDGSPQSKSVGANGRDPPLAADALGRETEGLRHGAGPHLSPALLRKGGGHRGEE